MAFPLDPTNGEQTTQNGIVYIYNATLGVWAVLTNTAGNISAGNIVVTNSVASDTVTAAGNISGNYFIGNGSQLTGITAGTSYTNANVEAYLPTYTGNLVSLTGNITTTANVSGNYFIGNGSQLTGISAGGGGDGGVANSGVFLNAQTITANVDISNVYNAFSVGPLTQAANVVVTQAAGSRWVIL
jgi:hypothetical protein